MLYIVTENEDEICQFNFSFSKKKKKKSQVPKIKRVSQNILRISPETTTASTTAF